MDREDREQTAARLRLEAGHLEEEAKRLRQAADLILPSSPANLPGVAGNGQKSISSVPDGGRRETITEIAVSVLKAAGSALTKEMLFEEVQNRSGGKTAIESFTSALSRSTKVVHIGGGRWDLSERSSQQLSMPVVKGTEPTLESIREKLRQRTWRTSDLAKEFDVDKKTIRKIIRHPDSGIELRGPGWLGLKKPKENLGSPS